ncbi:MAG TPA: substrate-binding domain-containing protein [Clostridia bacterium]
MSERKCIGLFLNDLEGNYNTTLFLMMKKAAERNDVNLFIFEGRSLMQSDSISRQYHLIYEFISKRRIEGLILTPPLWSNIQKSDYVKFINKFKHIPMVSIGEAIYGIPSIVYDNCAGMKSLILHLIKDHGYRKIAFVTGPQNSVESTERYKGYLEAHGECCIEVCSSLLFNGDFETKTGFVIMQEIVANKIECDAIVFANDDMASGAIKFLNGIEYTGELNNRPKICGFDDTIYASLIKPALTTVRQPIEELCIHAIESIKKILAGEKICEVVNINSSVVIRESCGCDLKDDYYEKYSYLRLVPSYRVYENLQTYSIEELFNRITETARECTIRSLFISSYSDGTFIYDENSIFENSFVLPPKSNLMYAYYNFERLDIPAEITTFETMDIVPDNFVPKDRRFIYLVNPLFFNNEHYGFIVFEVDNDDFVSFGPFRGQIGITLKIALTLAERERMEKSLMEAERLAALGQLMGGISHNMLTPIMSISGTLDAVRDLVEEYRESIGNIEVTLEDHAEIAGEMLVKISNIKDLVSYMSKVLTSVKAKAVEFNSNEYYGFTIGELVSSIEFAKYNTYLNRTDDYDVDINVYAEYNTMIPGNIANLMTIMKGLVKNAIESYDETSSKKVAYVVLKKEENRIIISISDYGKGIPEGIKNKIFKNMITTKGKNGTGLSLMFSYSTITGKFGGEMWFESKESTGTSFYISLPCIEG